MPNDKEFELDDLESFSFDDLSLDDTPSAAEAGPDADPLGVWVKSAPEDVDSSGGSPSPSVESFPAPADDGLPEEDFLSTEELANLDDSFEFVTVSEEPLTGETDLDEDMAFLDTPEAVEAERASKESDETPSFNEVSLDDFVTFDDVSLEDDTPEAAPVLETATDEGLATSLDDEGFDEEFLDIDIDIENDIGDDELEIIEGSRPKLQEKGPEPALSSQDIDIGEFVDFEEVAPSQKGPLAEGEDLPEVSDVPASDTVIAEDDGFFEESVIEESLPNIQDEGEVPLDADLEPDDHTDMDHILALEEDLTSGIRQPAAAGSSPAPSGPDYRQEPDLAAQILGKIEQELSSIKQEISELKKEMTHFRVAPPAPAAETVAPSPGPVSPDEPSMFPEPEEAASEEETSKASHGFFDEEDDETIALTGDELDNILSTAEISEGEEVGLSLDEDLLNLDADGNLIEPENSAEAESEDLHVTDEEFLAGTALDLNEPAFDEDTETEALLDLPEISESEEASPLGVPESIELEESLPLDLDDAETEDLLADDLMGEAPLEPQLAAQSQSDSLETEVPLEDEVGLESIESAPLTPELAEDSPLSEDWDLDALPPLGPETEELTPDFGTDAEGWSAPPAELEAEPEPAPAPSAPLPPPPPVSPPAPAKEGTALSANVKDELRAVLSYMDKLLASLPDDKIQEFAESEHFEVYKRLFEELGLIE